MPHRRTLFERVLYYYPVIHAQSDLGTLGDVSHQIIRDKIGEESLAERITKINKLWEKIRKSVTELDIDYKKARIYQDGLPICNYADKIVNDLASSGSINHQIILELQEKGSVLMGTECPDFLLDEYYLIKEALLGEQESKEKFDLNKFKADQDLLLHKRDEFIANRINDTLNKKETGILFLGVLHTIEALLDKDIHVIHPIDIGLSIDA